MTRYILIDDNSGHIWGDSADLDGAIFAADDPIEYAAALDRATGDPDWSYAWSASSGGGGYHVYRADVRGSDAITVVWDGQDRDTINAVEQGCEYLGFITRNRK